MSKEMKVALIGAAATILAAIITGIFLLKSQSTNVATTVTSASAGSTTHATQSTLTQPVNTTTSPPESTLTTYCNAMKQSDYPTAYDQFSSQTKSLVSEDQFASNNLSITQSKGGIADCTFSNVQTNGSSGTALLTYIYGDGETAPTNLTLILENGVWKIEGATS